MRHCVFSILALTLLTPLAFAQESTHPSEKDSSYFSFLGAEILAKHKSQMLPIIFTNKKGVFLETPKGIKRRSWSGDYSAKPKFCISNRLIEIHHLKYNFLYLKGSNQEESAYEAIRNKEREIAFKSATIDEKGAYAAAQIEKLEKELQEYVDEVESMILEGQFDVEGHADSINLSMSLISPEDIKDVYCAVIVGYKRINEKSPRFDVGIQKLGNLMQSIPEDTEFSVFIGEGDFSQPTVEILLYSGDGSAIATNLSRHLRHLTPEEKANLQKN